MKSGRGTWGLGLFLAANAIAANAQGPATSVTLFNSGRVLVRRTLTLAIPSGASSQLLPLGLFDPSTLTSLDADVRVTSTMSDATISEETLLRRYVGRTLEIDTGRTGSRRATLLAVDPERWEWADRPGVLFRRPGSIVWPRELVPMTVVADVTMQAERARSNIRVMYETVGSAWSASYRLFLGAQGRVEGTASVYSGTLGLKDAEVQLFSGDIGQRGQPAIGMRSVSLNEKAAYMDAAPMAAAPSMGSETSGEGHLYSLASRISFVPGTTISVPLFEPTPARAERRYTVGGSLQYYGGINQQPDEQDAPVEVAYRLERKTGTPFGDLAIPAGSVAVFDADKGGRMQLVGQGNINHVAAGVELLVSSGTAFDVTAKRVQTDYSVTRSTTAPVRTIGIAAYRVTLQNAKDSAVTVDVREDHSGDWSVVESSVPSQKRSSTRVVFPVTVPARGTVVLTYRLRVVW